MSAKISVIIPYYQEEAGILREAALSAMAQEGVTDLEIIVVDDGSPAPARDDFWDLDPPAHVTLKLIEQPNRGPGAARNRGLEKVRPGTTYVAFLDSDDSWTRDHLRNAYEALELGYDFYFSNYWNSEAHMSLFDARFADIARRCICIDQKRGLFESLGRPDVDLLHGLCQITSVVYRYDKLGDVRFPERFHIGEDLAFARRVVEKMAKVVFSSALESATGKGIHIYLHSGWGTPRHIWYLHHSILWRKWMMVELDLTDDEINSNLKAIRSLRKSFVAGVFREIRKLRAFKSLEIFRFIRSDPVVLLYIVPVGIRMVIRRMRSFRSGGWR